MDRVEVLSRHVQPLPRSDRDVETVRFATGVVCERRPGQWIGQGIPVIIGGMVLDVQVQTVDSQITYVLLQITFRFELPTIRSAFEHY